jgi:hypothetical protein
MPPGGNGITVCYSDTRVEAILMSYILHPDLCGWWRILETSQWVNKGLDAIGPAMLSITGRGDRLRMHCLLAYVNVRPTKARASFTGQRAWEIRSRQRHRKRETEQGRCTPWPHQSQW